MHLLKLPETLTENGLDNNDFQLFAPLFTACVLKEIPTSRSVFFVTAPQFQQLALALKKQEKEALFDRVVQSGQPEKGGETLLVLPLLADTVLPMVIVVGNVDPTVVSRTSTDWLVEITTVLHQRFIEIKKENSDSLTGFYKRPFLESGIDAMIAADDDCHIILVEMQASTRFPRDLFAHVRFGVQLLKEFNRNDFPVFSIGNAVYCLVIQGEDRDFLKQYCLGLITFCRHKGLKRVHCGCSSIRQLGHGSGKEKSRKGITVIEEGWTALHAACRRGPFAFCDYDIIANPDRFPLKPLKRSVLAKLQRRWKGLERYTLICFKQDFPDRGRLADIGVRYFGTTNYVLADDEIYVIIADRDPDDSRKWAESIIKRLVAENKSGYSMSAGISGYPFLDYSRTEIARNCQKALKHAEFLGYGSAVIFDATSLNISGDIYYNEGDLVSAVKEYRKGLALDGEQSNLLNSLGVAYALMNRREPALAAFRKVLSRQPHNFMALYNLGVENLSGGNYQDAVHFFQLARKVINRNDPEQEQRSAELLLHLGISSYYAQEYRQSVHFLEEWYRLNEGKGNRQKYARFIGLSFYYLGFDDDAKVWLQRAIVFDDQDNECLSILGELYIKSNEGDEIGIKLLEKSLEQGTGDIDKQFRYGSCLNMVGAYEQALPVLRQLVKRGGSLRHKVWYQLLIAYRGLKQYNKARYYKRKLLSSDTVTADLVTLAGEMKLS